MTINEDKKSNLIVRQCPPRHINVKVINYINFMVEEAESALVA